MHCVKLLLFFMILANCSVKSLIQSRRFKNTQPAISGGQATITFVSLFKKNFVVKSFHDRLDFENEAYVLSKLRHCENVIQPIFVDPNNKSIAFCKIDGGDLTKANIQRYSDTELRMMARQLVETVQCVHQAGFVHFDIKPENVLLADSEIKITLIDYGLARPAKYGERRVGSLATMAPEMLQASMFWLPITKAADWWSVGVTLFYLFAKRFKIYDQAHFGHYPYCINEERIEWPERLPDFPVHLLDLLYGKGGLLMVDPRLRCVDGRSLLDHTFFCDQH